ncbi:MAG: glycosyltransferase [Prevotella sp.]|nr:glycosyltransferase [Prevotella sp.]
MNKPTATQKDTLGQCVVAVVVTYNRKKLLKECLIALTEQNYPNLQILIIDNASTDGTYSFIAHLIDDKKIIYKNTGKNLGGAGGFNFGMRAAVERGCDYVWLMDDDCIVNEDSLTTLINFAHAVNANFGFLSSVVRWQDGSICRMNVPKITIS